jgi:hypothetical protein
VADLRHVIVLVAAALVAIVFSATACTSGRTPAKSTAAPSTRASATPAPSSATAPAPNYPGFPDATSTGVPAGTKLTAYTGPAHLTKCGTVINAKLIRGDITVDVGNKSSSANSPCITITNSQLIGTINTGPDPGKLGPLVMRHVEVAPPEDSLQQAVVGSNFYLYNVNVHGGANGGVDCAGYCGVYDSWIHDFYLAGATHYDAIISNGLYNGAPLVVSHNTLDCDFYAQAAGATGGCSANLGLYGDFAPISNVTVTNNLFVASVAQAYCFYGGAEDSKKFPNTSHVVVTGNTFQRGSNGKCANFGPIAYFSSTATGNVWTNNLWSDGAMITPPSN